jgi:drug/metabolite transporter (DMT)-like permease
MNVERLGLERRDGRNMLVVAAVVAAVVAVTAEGPVGARVVAGAIAGVVAGVVFVGSTLLINRYKPDHW